MSDPRCLTIEHATDLTIDTRRLNDRNGYQNVDLVKQPTDPMLETTVVSLRNAHRSTASLSRWCRGFVDDEIVDAVVDDDDDDDGSCVKKGLQHCC